MEKEKLHINKSIPLSLIWSIVITCILFAGSLIETRYSMGNGIEQNKIEILRNVLSIKNSKDNISKATDNIHMLEITLARIEETLKSIQLTLKRIEPRK